MAEIIFVKENKVFEAGLGSNLRDSMIESKISAYSNIFAKLFNCRGNGFCGTCKVIIESGAVDPPNHIENKKLKGDLQKKPLIYWKKRCLKISKLTSSVD